MTQEDMKENVGEDLEQQACLVLYHIVNGARIGIGRVYEFSPKKEIFVGDGIQANIQVEPEGPFSMNARLYYDEKEKSWYVENTEYHNNIHVNSVLTRSRKLNDGDLIQLGNVIFRFLDGYGVESTFHRSNHELIGIDALTEISNQRQVHEELLRSISYCNRSERPFCLVMVDVDNFGKTNTTYGHAGGDAVLKQLCKRIRQNIRTEDIFGRDGGEEFLIGLPNLSHDKALVFMERIRKKVTKDPVLHKTSCIPVSFSAGLVEWKPKMDLLTLKGLADELMYEAKRRGKNQLVG